MSKLLLDDRNLARQKLFWAAIITPFLGFIFLGWFAWKDYNFELSRNAYDKFMEISKFPLLFLSLSVPLVAIIAHIHRTIQTEKQISHTQKQIDNTQKQIALLEEKNKPDSYYAHVKSITEALTSIPGFKIHRNDKSKIDISIKYPHPLYKKIFNKSSIKNGYNSEINVEFLTAVKKCYMRINSALANAHTNTDPAERLYSANLLNVGILLMCDELSLNYDRHGYVFKISAWGTEKTYFTSFSSEVEIKEMIHGIRGIIIDLCNFLDVNYDFMNLSMLDGDYISAYLNSDLMLFEDSYPVGRHNPVEVYIKNGGNVAADDKNPH